VNLSERPAQERASTSTRDGTPDGFGLSGRSIVLDRRIHAVRGDVADIALAGVLFAPHYARAMRRRCIVPIAAMREAPGDDAELISELLHGEAFDILDLSGGWAWGYSAHDHYVGYVREDVLGLADPPAWRVSVRAADLLNAPAAGASVKRRLSLGALVDGVVDDAWLATADGWIALAALAPSDASDRDPVAIAEQMIGAPYLMAGRSVDGIDCSGLIQIALSFAGILAPRDSDLQAEALGMALAPGTPLRRGDLVFFPGHVGMMADDILLLHANGHAGAVSLEPLADATTRMEPEIAAAMTARRL